jgi:hypothetical protein
MQLQRDFWETRQRAGKIKVAKRLAAVPASA